MDPFHAALMVRAATIDELLSDDFEALPGQKGDSDIAASRLAAWCRAAASGDWLLFARRLKRDGLAIEQVLPRLATIRRKPSAATPAWLADAVWIEQALHEAAAPADAAAAAEAAEGAFAPLLAPLIAAADARLWASLAPSAGEALTASARADLRRLLRDALCSLCAPALYERFSKLRQAGATPAQEGATAVYDRFAAEMRGGAFRRLFGDKPVLLRLIATITGQWLATSRELVTRIASDLPAIAREILQSAATHRVAVIAGDLSDPHNGGHAVLVIALEDGARVVYKPKDLRLDAAWLGLVERLNQAGAPIALKVPRAIVRDGYGWTEHIAHAGCADADGCRRYFERAGAWLALFHCFATTDMHQENMIAAGEHPVPIDLETSLQVATEDAAAQESEAQAFEAAKEIVGGSVMAIGLLPAYAKTTDNAVYAVGGVAADGTERTRLAWSNVNSDTMRPLLVKVAAKPTPNLPHVDGRYARLGAHVEDLIAGFAAYARFLQAQTRGDGEGGLFDGLAGLPVRKVARPTQFYYMLLHRLKDDRSWDDGVTWSAQADFLARLADWNREPDLMWPLQQAERAALLTLNVPYFVLPSDRNQIIDAPRPVEIAAVSGLARARARVRGLDDREIAWQIDVIRQNASIAGDGPADEESQPLPLPEAANAPALASFQAEADRIAAEIARHAIRRGPGAAWIGLSWMRDSEVSQLTVMGPDLYNGASGIALFLAAHAATAQRPESAELARAAVAHLRKTLAGPGAARLARSIGIGGATGLGSIVYAFTVMATLLHDERLRADAVQATTLISGDMIAADRQLDVIGGSAGAILGLLRLHRDTGAAEVLARARQCGEHLLTQPRVGPEGRRSWRGMSPHALNGMSHGAAGFAYALAALAAATGREDFADAAAECIACENASYDAEQANWPDLRRAEPNWRSQWCHGAVGIGLARLATAQRGSSGGRSLNGDVRNALAGAASAWPGHVDTLCCGTLGSIELMCQAGDALAERDLRALAARRLMAVLESGAARGDYRWNAGGRRFNLGLFRGLAGVGYTCLRQVSDSLPNVLTWE